MPHGPGGSGLASQVMPTELTMSWRVHVVQCARQMIRLED